MENTVEDAEANEAFNRTGVELKLPHGGQPFLTVTATFNRTGVELKRVMVVPVAASLVPLLIEPEWN